MERKLELIPDQDKKSSPLFDTEEAYQKFRASYYEQIKPELDRHSARRAA